MTIMKLLESKGFFGVLVGVLVGGGIALLLPQIQHFVLRAWRGGRFSIFTS